MNRYFKAFSLICLIVSLASCKKDDGASIAPPRDRAEQNLADIDSLETYLKTHYIASVDEDFNIDIQEIPVDGDQVSIWDQEEYPLQTKVVTRHDVEYTIHYLILNEGVGDMPTRGDNVDVGYRGTLLDGTQFDYNPFPQSPTPLLGLVEGWQEIIPLFKSGVYVEEPGSPDPAEFTDYGAGVMFLPSGMAYFNNTPSSLVKPYSCMVFSFKLFDVDYTDLDEDGILNKFETENGIDIADYDTDEDELPNFLDSDDDGDGYTTKREIENPETEEPYPFEEIPTCPGGSLKKHLDPNCH